jgi:hypothetical protein
MRYRIPDETARGVLPRLAVRASAPYWAALLTGFLPAVIWSTANAWFLGCRDARWQTGFAIIGYGTVAAIGAARMYMKRSGDMYLLFGHDARLADALMDSAYYLGSLIVLRVLVGRQIDLAAYRSTLGRGLPWGVLMIAAFAALDRFVFPQLYALSNQFFWIWGPSRLL